MSSLGATGGLAVAEMILYIIYMFIGIFILLKHGKRGYLGWGFFILFCILRIAADGFQISDQIQENKGESISTTGAIVNSIGVSPLLMCISGMLSET